MSDLALSLNLLGSSTLVAGEVPVALSPSSTLLCAYLALAPQEGRTRSVAAAQLFADCSEPAARRRLNTALWRLKSEVRASTGVDIVAGGDTRRVAFSAAVDVIIDASVFEQLVASALRRRPEDLMAAEVASLERAVELHRGALVEECDDEWVLADRYRLENLYLTALDHLVQHHGGRGDLDAVTRYGEMALEHEPLREDVHRHLMHAYGAAGRTDLVERQFERCRQRLLEQLGADPMPETLAAYSRYLHGDARGPVAGLDELVSELERARREVQRLAESVDRALDRLHHLA